jgi:hypothetical protein
MANGLSRMAARCLIFIAIAIFTAPGAGWAADSFRLTPVTRFFLGMEWTYLWLSGDLLVPAGGRPGSGTQIDLSNDLGMEQTEASSIRFEATVLDTHRLVAEFLMALPTAARKAPHAFVFHNRTYAKNARLDTRLDVNWLRCAYEYKLLDLGSCWVAPTVGLHHVRFSSTINGETEEAGMVSNTRTLDGTYPVVGLEARYLLPHGLDAGLELEGMHFFGRGYVTAARLRGQIELHPDVVASVSVWHRLVSRVENNQELNNEWSYSLSGLSAGISFGF